jgi:hypothetical protein
MNENVSSTFFPKAKRDEKKVIASFIAGTSENALKTKPKVDPRSCELRFTMIDKASDQGYAADSKDIALLRLRNFTIGKKIPDADILADDGLERIAAIIGALVPWVCSPVLDLFIISCHPLLYHEIESDIVLNIL